MSQANDIRRAAQILRSGGLLAFPTETVYGLGADAANVDAEGGVYHYAVREHELELVRAGDFRARTVDQALGQEFLGECGAVIFLTQIMQRMRPKYQDRSYRYGLLEAGHIGENGYLAAVLLGLGACGVGPSWTTPSTRCSAWMEPRRPRSTCWPSATQGSAT